MADNRKNAAGEGPYINLNVRLFLTDLGEEAYGKAEADKASVTQDGTPGAAIEGERLFARTLKEFMISRKVIRIELERMELVSRRHEITDLSKLILYSRLYRLFPANLLRLFRQRGLEPAGEATEEQILEWRRRIMTAGLAGVSPVSKERDPELEQKTLRSIAGRLVAALPAGHFAWILGREEELIGVAAALVKEYLERSRISDHLSAAFLEWVNFAERLNLERGFEKYRKEYHTDGIATMEAFLKAAPGNRALLEKMISRDRISLKINWKFGSVREKTETGVDEQATVRLRLINKGLIGEALQSVIGSFLSADTRGHHAGEFDHESDAPIGFLFTSFLRESCRRLGIDIFVKIWDDKRDEATVMSLTLRLNPA